MTLRLTGKWPQRNPDSLRDAIAPFRCKLRRVFVEQLIGVDAVAHEGPAAEVVNEQIMGHGQLEPGPARAFGKIIVVEKSESEAFVEPADRLVDRTFHEQAEPGEFGNSKPRPAVLLSPSLGECGHVFEALVTDILDQLRRRGVVGHGPDETDHPILDFGFWIFDSWAVLGVGCRRWVFPGLIGGSLQRFGMFFRRFGFGGLDFLVDDERRERDELIEPSVGNDDVVVEQHEVFAARKFKPLVDGCGEPAIYRVADDGDGHGRGVLEASQVICRSVGRSVVDDDQFPVGPGLPHERDDALPGILELVPAGNDD